MDIWEDFHAAEAAEAERHARELAEDYSAEALVEGTAAMFELEPEHVALALLAVSAAVHGD